MATGDNEYLLITGSESDFDWVSAQASEFDVEVSNITSTWTTLAVQGPESRPVIEALVDPEVVDSLPYYGFARTNVVGSECLLARMGYTGEFGYEFHLAPDGAEALWMGCSRKGRARTYCHAAKRPWRAYARRPDICWWATITTRPRILSRPESVVSSPSAKREFNGRAALAAIERAASVGRWCG